MADYVFNPQFSNGSGEGNDPEIGTPKCTLSDLGRRSLPMSSAVKSLLSRQGGSGDASMIEQFGWY